MKKLKGKTALVVGATGDIGGELAISLASMGAFVIAAGRNREKLKRFDRNGMSPMVLDSSDIQKVIYSRDWILANYKKIDILVTSVGTWQMIDLNAKPDDFDIQLCTDLESVAKAAIIPIFAFNQYFRERKSGFIIDISSHAAEDSSLIGNLTYAPAKAAVKRFADNLRNENGLDSGVVISQIVAQLVDTPKNRASNPNIDENSWKGAVQIGDMASWIADNAGNPKADINRFFASKIKL